MAELITCAECGKSLSSSVKYRCIHCGNDPRPKKCLFCNKTLKASDVALKEDVTLHSIGSHTYYFCKNCIENLRNNVETERFSCPTCHGLLYYKDFQKEEARCPQCGESLYFGACRFCGKRYEKNSAHNECYKLYEKKATEENKRLSEYKYDAKANVLGVITALILSVIGCILGIIAGLLLYIPNRNNSKNNFRNYIKRRICYVYWRYNLCTYRRHCWFFYRQWSDLMELIVIA